MEHGKMQKYQRDPNLLENYQVGQSFAIIPSRWLTVVARVGGVKFLGTREKKETKQAES